MAAYPIGIVGESFDNEDGSSRQSEIKRCRPGEHVKLEREPSNKYDSKCVKVISDRGVQIGNIRREDAWISDRIDHDRFIDARILSIRINANRMRGVVICVRTAEDDDWMTDGETDTALQTSTGCSLVLLGSIASITALIGSMAR